MVYRASPTSCGTSCTRSRALTWSSVSMAGDKPPWRQKIWKQTKLDGEASKQTKNSTNAPMNRKPFLEVSCGVPFTKKCPNKSHRWKHLGQSQHHHENDGFMANFVTFRFRQDSTEGTQFPHKLVRSLGSLFYYQSGTMTACTRDCPFSKSRIFPMHVIFVYSYAAASVRKYNAFERYKASQRIRNGQRLYENFMCTKGWSAQDAKIECVRNILDLQYVNLKRQFLHLYHWPMHVQKGNLFFFICTAPIPGHHIQLHCCIQEAMGTNEDKINDPGTC